MRTNCCRKWRAFGWRKWWIQITWSSRKSTSSFCRQRKDDGDARTRPAGALRSRMAKISPFARRFLDSVRGIISDSVFRHCDQELFGIEYGRICGTAAGVHGDGLGDGLQREPFSMSALRARIRARALVRVGFDSAAL